MCTAKDFENNVCTEKRDLVNVDVFRAFARHCVPRARLGDAESTNHFAYRGFRPFTFESRAWVLTQVDRSSSMGALTFREILSRTTRSRARRCASPTVLTAQNGSKKYSRRVSSSLGGPGATLTTTKMGVLRIEICATVAMTGTPSCTASTTLSENT